MQWEIDKTCKLISEVAARISASTKSLTRLNNTERIELLQKQIESDCNLLKELTETYKRLMKWEDTK